MIRRKLSVPLTALALTAAAVVAFAPANAHDGHGRGFGAGGDPTRMVERMTRHLDLDATQQAEVENILTAAKPEFDALRERARANRTAMRELKPGSADYSARVSDVASASGQLVTDGAVLLGRVRAEVHAVLTPEQAAELEAFFAERMERAEKRRGQRRR